MFNFQCSIAHLFFIILCVNTIGHPQSTKEENDSLPVSVLIPADTIVCLEEVNIFSSKYKNFSAGSRVFKYETRKIEQYASRNLSELLQTESSPYIKSYGPGNLALTSFRGGSAQHTAVLWNGYDINNPMTGQIDLSTIPVFFLERVELQHGGECALFGSGAVGGTIHLNTGILSEKKFKAGAEISYGNYSGFTQNVKLSGSGKHWASGLKFSHSENKNENDVYSSLNDFNNNNGLKQKNAERSQYGILNENSIFLSGNQKINFSMWLQKNDRNLPSLLNETSGYANQKDENQKISLAWNKAGKRFSHSLQSAFLRDELIYKNDKTHINSQHLTKSFITGVETKWHITKNQTGFMGINYTSVQAISKDLTSNPVQNRPAVYSSYRYNSVSEKLGFTLSIRKEFLKNIRIPFTWSSGLEYKVIHGIFLKSKFSRIFRTPSLNDLYWQPGGNPELLPEDGYSSEAGLLIKKNNLGNNLEFSLEVTGFNRNVNNWIIWLPLGENWSPGNLMEVWSRGTETISAIKILSGKSSFSLSIFTNYVLSTNEKAKTENDQSVGKQLIYVPLYSGTGNISYEYKNYAFGLNQQYVRYRYTSTDNSEYLEPYALTNLYTSFTLNFKNYKGVIYLSADNIFNEYYEVVKNYPMPPVNFRGGVRLEFFSD